MNLIKSGENRIEIGNNRGKYLTIGKSSGKIYLIQLKIGRKKIDKKHAKK